MHYLFSHIPSPRTISRQTDLVIAWPTAKYMVYPWVHTISDLLLETTAAMEGSHLSPGWFLLDPSRVTTQCLGQAITVIKAEMLSGDRCVVNDDTLCILTSWVCECDIPEGFRTVEDNISTTSDSLLCGCGADVLAKKNLNAPVIKDIKRWELEILLIMVMYTYNIMKRTPERTSVLALVIS